MSLVELGERLRAERLKRNLSVDEIASHLKMAPRVIRDLEDGNESALPPVYVRGFLKSYSQYLNIDPDALTSAIESMDAPSAGVSAKEPLSVPPPRTPRRGKGLPGALLLAVCLAGGAGFWYYSTHIAPGTTITGLVEQVRAWTHPDAPTTTQLPSTAARLAPRGEDTAPSSRASAPSPQARAAEASGKPEETRTAQSDAAVSAPGGEVGRQGDASGPITVEITPSSAGSAAPADSASSVHPVQDSETGTAERDAALAMSDEDLLSQSGAVEEAPMHVEGFIAPRQSLPESGAREGSLHVLGLKPGAARGGNVLVFTGLAECWVQVTADETDTRQFSVLPGQVFSMSFTDSLVLKLGNAGGVRLTYNGSDLPAPGKDGQLATLTFPEAARQ